MQESSDTRLRIFILGPARSGTSAILLALHDVLDLAGEGESHVIPAFQRAIYHFARSCEPFRDREGVLARLLDANDFQNHALDYLRRFYARNVSDRCFVDKTPGAEAIAGAPLIRQAFPDARIILTRRNGIEVVRSHQGMFDSAFVEACTGWTACMQAIEEIRPHVPDLLEIDHADLAGRPDAVAEWIARYIGRPDSSASLAKFLTRSPEAAPPARPPARLADTGWLPEQQQQFRAICGDAMQRFGYPF